MAESFPVIIGLLGFVLGMFKWIQSILATNRRRDLEQNKQHLEDQKAILRLNTVIERKEFEVERLTNERNDARRTAKKYVKKYKTLRKKYNALIDPNPDDIVE